MRYATAAAFRHALEQRLLQETAQQQHASPARLRKLVVFDRLLARLLVVAPDRWVVKGGVALELRLGNRARTTKDLDLARQDGEEYATADLIRAQEIDLADFFGFRIERRGDLDEAREGAAVGYHVLAELAGRPFETVIIDINTSDPFVATPDRLKGPDLLGFAGFAPIAVPALPLEQHLAEKVHAYTRTYGAGHRSSRVKDLVDIVLIRSVATFAGGRLRSALDLTFATQGTHPIPAAVPPPPPEWRSPYRALAKETGLDPDVASGHRLAATFLDPVLGGTVADNACWEPVQSSWLRPSAGANN